MTAQQFIPPEVLSELRLSVADYYDSIADWYRSVDASDVHADKGWSAPVQLPARFIRQTREFYTQGGQQAQVLMQIVHLPWDKAQGITPNDKLVPKGTDVQTRWPTILEITYVPDIAEPLEIRVRQGAV